MRKIALLLVALVMVVSLVFGAFGCTASAPKVTEWKLSTHMDASQYPVGVVAQHFCDEVFARTNGELKITIYPSDELGYKAMDYMRHIRDGSFEMCGLSNPFLSGDFPLINLHGMLFLWPSMDMVIKGVQEGDAKIVFPILEKNFNCVGLWQAPMPEQHIWSKDEPLTSLEAFKGFKLRVYSKDLSDLFSAMGSLPVTMPGGEVYMALQTGLISGLITSGTTAHATNTFEVIKYGTLSRLLFSQFIYLANKDAVDRLPGDVQKTFKQVASEMYAYHLEQTRKYNKLDMDKMVGEGTELIEMPDSVRSKVIEVAKAETWETHINDCEKAGYGDEARELLRAYMKVMGGTVPPYAK